MNATGGPEGSPAICDYRRNALASLASADIKRASAFISKTYLRIVMWLFLCVSGLHWPDVRLQKPVAKAER